MNTKEYVSNVISSFKQCPEEDGDETRTESISFLDDALELLLSENDEIMRRFFDKHTYPNEIGFVVGNEAFKPFQVKIFLRLSFIQEKHPLVGLDWYQDEEKEECDKRMRRWIIDFVSHPCFIEYSPSELVRVYGIISMLIERLSDMLEEKWHSPTSSFVLFSFASIKAGVYPWDFPME